MEQTLKRFTLFDMRECTDEDLARIVPRVIKAGDALSVISRGDRGPFKWFVVESGKTLYQVWRLFHFSYCNCAAFQQGHNLCKHIAATFAPRCVKCGSENFVPKHGAECRTCEMGARPYLKPTSTKVEMFGRFKI